MTQTYAARTYAGDGLRPHSGASGPCWRLPIANRRLAWPVLLLLAAIANPAVGVPRPLDSLRLVVSIHWLSEDHAAVETPAADRRTPAPAPDASHLSSFGAPDSRARSTALPSSTFQRPPPLSTLRG